MQSVHGVHGVHAVPHTVRQHPPRAGLAPWQTGRQPPAATCHSWMAATRCAAPRSPFPAPPSTSTPQHMAPHKDWIGLMAPHKGRNTFFPLMDRPRRTSLGPKGQPTACLGVERVQILRSRKTHFFVVLGALGMVLGCQKSLFATGVDRCLPKYGHFSPHFPVDFSSNVLWRAFFFALLQHCSNPSHRGADVAREVWRLPRNSHNCFAVRFTCFPRFRESHSL